MSEPTYTPTTWHDRPAVDSPLSAGNLSKLELGVKAATDRAAGSVRKAALDLAPGQVFGVDAAGDTVGYNYVLAYAEYADGAAYALTPSTPFYFPGTAISVPPVPNRDLSIRYSGGFSVTVAGAGQIAVVLYETTSGNPVGIDSAIVVGGFLAGTGSSTPQIPVKECPLGPTTTERQFVLGGLLTRDAASSLAASIKTGSVIRNPWWIRAVA